MLQDYKKTNRYFPQKLEIGTKKNVDTLRAWAEKRRGDLKPIIKDYLPKKSIGNERRSGGTCGTTYWITPVRHEAADAESAPMPLAMPCLVPRHGGGSVARHEHRAKGRLSNSSEPPYLITA
nr:NADH dehydrogenase [ubiquinone] iron-sulfur protein 2 [Ipomoea batatas]